MTEFNFFCVFSFQTFPCRCCLNLQIVLEWLSLSSFWFPSLDNFIHFNFFVFFVTFHRVAPPWGVSIYHTSPHCIIYIYLAGEVVILYLPAQWLWANAGCAVKVLAPTNLVHPQDKEKWNKRKKSSEFSEEPDPAFLKYFFPSLYKTAPFLTVSIVIAHFAVSARHILRQLLLTFTYFISAVELLISKSPVLQSICVQTYFNLH